MAAMAKTRKEGKYATMEPSHSFQPIAVETTGVLDPDTFSFMSALCRRIYQTSGYSEGKQCLCHGNVGKYFQPRGLFHVASCCKYEY